MTPAREQGSSRNRLYVGRAGQMAVMAEFLWRGWNVAIPEVDVGEDVFVVEDETGDLYRVQVKTATAQAQRSGYAARFTVALSQLETLRTPDLFYIFAIRMDSSWEPFVVISRDDLHREYVSHRAGHLTQAGGVTFRFVWDGTTLRSGGRDFRQYRNDWSRWPTLKH